MPERLALRFVWPANPEEIDLEGRKEREWLTSILVHLPNSQYGCQVLVD